MLEKDRDGCPRIVNIGVAKKDAYYEEKRYGLSNKTPTTLSS